MADDLDIDDLLEAPYKKPEDAEVNIIDESVFISRLQRKTFVFKSSLLLVKFIHTFIKNLSLTGWIDRSFKYTYFQVFNVKQTKEKVKTNLQYFMMQIKLIYNNYN